MKRRGAAAIEFALWQPILFLLLSSAVDLSWYMSRRVIVTRAAHDGARAGAATLETTDQEPGSAVVPAAEAQAADVLQSMKVSCPGGIKANYEVISEIEYVTVAVNCPFQPLWGFFDLDMSLGTSFTMALETQTWEGTNASGGGTEETASSTSSAGRNSGNRGGRRRGRGRGRGRGRR